MFTKGLAEFICGTEYKDLPSGLVEAAKRAVLDYLAVTMSGSQEPSGRIMSEMVRENRSPEESTVIGGRFKASYTLAALANGTSAHTQDYDDCLDFPSAGLAHPTAGTFSGLLTLGEKNRISGKELITAYCLGVEAYGKTGLLVVEEGVGNRGWEWTGTLGVMGATAGLSKLLDFDERTMVNALGIAATLAGSLIRNFGSFAGHIHGGNAARNGIEAVTLAQKGYDATGGDVIEGRGGYYNAFSGKLESLGGEAQRQRLSQLGNPWNLLNPGLMFKYYPCAHIAHFGVYAAQQLREKHAFDWREIQRIGFRTPFARNSPSPPQTGVQGRFNLGYCLCRALIHGGIEFEFFTEQGVKDANTLSLMEKIDWEEIPRENLVGPFGYQEVILKMKDGKTYGCKVEHPKGEPQNPQSLQELEAKFRKCAHYARYDDSTASQIKDLVADLENLKDISRLTALLGR
jgi:2-methylcitrate dehydratase PrpD